MIEVFTVMLTIFFISGTLIALMSRKLLKKGFEEFVVGGYRVGGLLSAMTYAATTYSAFMMVGLVGLAYATGVAALGFELVYLAATVGILSTIGPIMWGKARERKWVSPSQMIGEVYSSKALAASIAILYLITLTPYLAAQLKGVGEIFNSLRIGYEVGVAIAFIATFLWIAIAGLWSVATTDAFQGLWMIASSIAIITWALASLLPSTKLSLEEMFNVLLNARISETQRINLLSFTWSSSMFIGLSIPWIFFAVTNPQVVQRIFIPKNAKAYRRMVNYFAFYGFIYTLICVFLGLIFRSYIATTHPDIELNLVKVRDSVTPTVLLKAPTVLASAVFVGIVAASISTANSIVLSAASSLTRDLYIAYSRNVNERKALMVTYIAVSLMMLIALFIALQRIAYVVELSVTSSALLLPLAPITIAGVYLEPRRRGLPYAVASLSLGLAITSTSIALFGPSKALSYPLALGLPSPFWALTASAIPTLLMVFKRRRWEC